MIGEVAGVALVCVVAGVAAFAGVEALIARRGRR